MNPIILAFFFAFVLALGAFAQTAPQSNPEDMRRYWQALVPTLPSVLRQVFPAEPIEEHYKVRIIETADIKANKSP